MIREVRKDDLEALLHLYTHLHETSVPEPSQEREEIWREILQNPRYHILIAEEDGRPVSSCTCVIVPNLTRALRPYALIENVVTDAAYRGQGLATACLQKAVEIAREAGCYKLMLMTGAKDESTLRFYEHAGFSRQDKTAFVRRLL